MADNNITRAWALYELGRNYNESLTPNQYTLVETNTEFFIGNQWLRLPDTPGMRGLPKPVFNVLKRIAEVFIASLTSSATTIHFDPLAYYDGNNIADPDHDAAAFANAAVANLLEKFKFDYRIRDALFDGAVSGDYCAHFWFDPDALPYGGAFAKFGAHRGEIKMELLDGINVMFGNPNERDVQKQPYVLLVGRDTVENLRAEAARYRKSGGPDGLRRASGTGSAAGRGEAPSWEAFQADSEYDRMPGVGGKVELPETGAWDTGSNGGKALFVYLYTKVTKEEPVIGPDGEPVYEDVLDADGNPVYEDAPLTEAEAGAPLPAGSKFKVRRPKRRALKRQVETVHVTKATRTAVIYEDVDTGLRLYPIAWGNWERQKNQYHGRALVTGLMPNQIFINSMMATAMRHMQLAAFPKTVYNADLIPRWDSEVGTAIGVHGLRPGEDIPQVAMNLSPAEMSAQIYALVDKVWAYTKECMGATDAQLGNVKPDNTSALMVLQTNAEVPLENIRANLYEWVEDAGAVLLDMIGTYYGQRPVVVERDFTEPMTGPDGLPVIDPNTGLMATQSIRRKAVESFDFSQFKHLWLNLRADVGATTYFSEIAMTQTLDNLRADGTLDVIQYLERLPDKLLPKKAELIEELRQRIAEGMAQNSPAQNGAQNGSSAGMGPVPGVPGAAGPGAGNGEESAVGNYAQGGPLASARAVQNVPGRVGQQAAELPEVARRAVARTGAMRAR